MPRAYQRAIRSIVLRDHLRVDGFEDEAIHAGRKAPVGLGGVGGDGDDGGMMPGCGFHRPDEQHEKRVGVASISGAKRSGGWVDAASSAPGAGDHGFKGVMVQACQTWAVRTHSPAWGHWAIARTFLAGSPSFAGQLPEYRAIVAEQPACGAAGWLRRS